MPRVSQAYLDERRRQILEAATACFARDGFHRATMQDIVAESGLSPGAIYNYFASKEDIVEAIAEERHRREEALLAAARDLPSARDALRGIREAFFGPLKDARERRRRGVSIQLWAEAQRNPRVLKIVRRGVATPRRILGELIRDAQRRREVASDLDADAVARVLIAAFHGFVLQLEWEPRTPVEPYVKVLDALLERWLPRPAPRGTSRGAAAR